MEGIITENAITRRVDLLQKFWASFRQVPTARCCCWVVPQDALSMIDTFYQVYTHKSSNAPEYFLRFETPFESAKSYGKMLSAELAAFVEADRSEAEEDGITIDWQSKHVEDKNNVAVGFLRNFFHFADNLEISDKSIRSSITPK